jgi:hypothetical protein
MTQTNILEQRKKSIAQRKNRLKQLETSLNAQARKKRTRHLIEIGGLVAKAKLDAWNANTLLGALLSLKDQESDTSKMDAWTHTGGALFASEKNHKTAVIVKFTSHPEDDIRASLKSLGLKWNSLRKEWEGYALLPQLKEMLGDSEVEVRKIGVDSA